MKKRAWFLAGLTLLGGCRGPVSGPYRQAPVILIVIDTLRADRLPVYGYRQGSTPALDRVAREGIVFDSVISHVPLTLPAHASLFTGILPPRHGVRDNLGFTLKREHKTLATRFKENGFATGGAVSAYVLRRATGIAQGFDFYDDDLSIDATAGALGAHQRDGAIAVDSLTRWIEGRSDRRFFAFLHLFEPHAPYAPPPQHRNHKDPYDGEVAYADELAGRFLDRLRSRGLLDRSILAVTSDHGEGLLDHGEQTHGFFLYREVVQVPFLLRLPGAAGAGRRVRGNVAQVDLPVTLLDLAGLPFTGMDGTSQRAGLDSGASRSQPIYSETFYPRYNFAWSELQSVTDERYRFIRAPHPELFDATRDPGEKTNLAAEHASAVASWNAWIEKVAGATSPAAPEETNQETREALRALGYIQGGASTPSSGPLPDPKDKLATYEAYRRALELQREGQADQAIAELQQVVKRDPEMVEVWEGLGILLVQRGRQTEGIAALDRAVALDPTRASVHIALARIHGLAGRREQAEKHAELASVRDPGKGFEVLAEIMVARNRPAEAAAYARRSLAADPDRVLSRFVLAVLARREGRYQEAIADYQQAARSCARQKGLVVRGLHAGLADCLARLGREAEAEREFLAEIAVIPASREARVGLAVLYRSQARDQEARQVLGGLVTANPRANADDYFTIARTLSELGDTAAAREWAGRAHTAFPADPRFR